MAPPTQLFEHRPDSILPLISSHLPSSIFIYGALITPSPGGPYAHRARIWSTIPQREDGSEISLAAEGTIIVDLPRLAGVQIKLFDTLESVYPPLPKQLSADGERDPIIDPDFSSGGSDEGTVRQSRIVEGRRRVVGALKAYLDHVDKEVTKAGGVHELWAEAVETMVGDGISRAGCGLWLPSPAFWHNVGMAGKGTIGRVDGYRVEAGHDEDLQEFSRGSDIERNPEYYTSRLPWSTVIRPIDTTYPDPSSSQSTSESPALSTACHILTHADGSIGSLSTHLQHRRKGLAQWIVTEHIRSGTGMLESPDGGSMAFAVIFERNEPSQRMFASLGWKRHWGCSWVTIGPREESEAGRDRLASLRELRKKLKGSGLVERNTLEGRC